MIGRRLKHGKELAARVNERRGISTVERPHGPLVWIHGASVGEVLAAAALIERLRALNIHILLTSGTVTSAAIVARRFPPDIIHQFIPYDAPRYVARFLDHWQPSLALFIESDIWPNLVLAGAARRLPMVLINGRMSPRSFPRWQRAAATIAALLGRFDLCLAQSATDAERFSALGSPQRGHHRQSEARRAAAARRRRQAGTADGDDARPPGGGGRLDPSRRRGLAAGGLSRAAAAVSRTADW